MKARSSRVSVRPLGPDGWEDFTKLFGERGACGGCWCMYWRVGRSQFTQNKGAGNRRAMKRLVESGRVPGLIAYVGQEPVGWCAVAPRGEYPALTRSRLFRPLDDVPVWSVSCLFVARSHRRRGISVALLKAAVRHVHRQGGGMIEGYPQEPRDTDLPDVFAWTGLASAFRQAGFEEVARPAPTRPVMRRRIRRGSITRHDGPAQGHR